MNARVTALVVSIAAATACGRGGPPPSAVGGGPATKSSAPWDVREQMKEHFVAASGMRDALIRGDVDAFTSAAAVIATESERGATWGRSDAVRDAASRARMAETIPAAARALSDLAVACGDCHRARGKPKGAVPAPPPAFAGGNPVMARHRWAVERMWEGLSSPSDEAWKKGSDAFADAPLVGDAFAGRDPTVQASAFALSARAHALGVRARTATATGDRANIFGEMFATCADCHSLARNTP